MSLSKSPRNQGEKIGDILKINTGVIDGSNMYSATQPEKMLEEMFLMHRVSVEVGANNPSMFNPEFMMNDPIGGTLYGSSRSSRTPAGLLGKTSYSVPYFMKGKSSSTSAYGLGTLPESSGLGNSYTTASAQNYGACSASKGGSRTGSSSAGGGK